MAFRTQRCQGTIRRRRRHFSKTDQNLRVSVVAEFYCNRWTHGTYSQLCECSQEQWDIYKLDPNYQCCVKAFPALSVINLKPMEPATTLPFRHINKHRTISPSLPSYTPKLQPESRRSTPFQSDVDESERMIIDDDNNCNQKPAPRRPRRKSPRTTRNLDFNFETKPVPIQPKPKRKGVVPHQPPQ